MHSMNDIRFIKFPFILRADYKDVLQNHPITIQTHSLYTITEREKLLTDPETNQQTRLRTMRQCSILDH